MAAAAMGVAAYFTLRCTCRAYDEGKPALDVYGFERKTMHFIANVKRFSAGMGLSLKVFIR